MSRAVFAAAAALCLAAGGSGVAQPAYHASCSWEDIQGVWALQRVEAGGAGEFYETKATEYLRFGEGGAFAVARGLPEMHTEAEVNAALDRADKADRATYTWRINDGAGPDLIILRDGKPAGSFRCVIQDHWMIWDQDYKFDRFHVRVR